MRKILTIITAATLAAAGCKKTAVTTTAPDSGAGAGAAATAPAATPAATTPSTAAPPQTAAGGEVGALAAVSDCPKSLAGSEEVARTIKKECGPIPVTGEYNVDGTLTLEAGAQLKFAENASLSVGYNKPSKLIVNGTAQDPVVFSTSADQVAGIWKGVRLYRHAGRSKLEGLVIEHAGDDNGALSIAAADVVVKGVTVRDAKEIGMRIENDVVVADLSGNTFEKAGALALSVPASALGGLGAGNKFDEKGVIEVRGGTVDKNAKWQNAGAPYLFSADTSIDGKNNVKATVEIQPGTELRFGSGVELSVGYSSAGALVAVGAADKPIVFTAGSDKTPGAWDGVMLYTHGDGRFENAVFEAGGGNEDRGVLFAQHEATASVKACTFKGNRVAMMVENAARLKEVAGSKFSGSEKIAVAIGPDELAALAADNAFDANERVLVRGGEVSRSATWNALGAAVEIDGDVSLTQRAVLTMAPGVELRFRDGTGLSIGYNDESSLKAVGTADKPIKLRGVREEAGSWDGVVIYNRARDAVVENVVIEHAGGEAGLQVRGPASVKVTNFICNKCAAGAVKWECESKVTTSGVKAGDGTPKAEMKPEGC